jgi:hypothetical protein
MANISQNQNQFIQTPMLAQLTNDPQPSTFACQIDPASAVTVINAGQAVKLKDIAGPQIMVDICTGPTDGPVFGVIAYNLRKNSYVPGDVVEVVGADGILVLASSAAIARGAQVAITPNTLVTNDPTIATNVVAGQFIAGIALGKASAAGQLIKVKIKPTTNNAAGQVTPQ